MDKTDPISVVILAFDGALASAITGAADLFSLSGVSWQRFHKQAIQPSFHVQICSSNGQNVQCINQIKLSENQDINTIDKCDLLLIPTIGADIDKTIKQNLNLLPHITRLRNQGAEIASNCSGAFFLAESGLLDNKEATTHWGYADIFQMRYPNVKLQTNKMITQSEGVFCAGGGMAWYDLALLLIERYVSRQMAQETAKSHLIDMQRGNQSVYANLRQLRQHKDEIILSAQQYIETHYHETISVLNVATHFHLSTRTLIRRFKKNVGITPIEYIQRVRLEQAKRILESERINVSVVAQKVGYEDISSFSRIFKRSTGLSPAQYKLKFAKPVS